MSRIQVWKDGRNRGFKVEGFIVDRDLAFDPNEIIERCKAKLIDKIVDRLWSELEPRLDAALADALKKGVEEQQR